MGRAVTSHLPRGVTLGLLLALTLFTGTARAETKTSTFEYASDATNWYWKDQIAETIAVGPVAQEVTLGNPQAPTTLPVAAQAGEPNKISALLFDLVSRGVEPGSSVSSFVFSIVEGGVDVSDRSQPDVQPPFNTQGKAIQACPIVGVWAGGEGAELWEQAPAYDESSCVTGERKVEGGTGRWSFDLSTLAAAWGEDPLANNGLMLVPVIEGNPAVDGTWQINLRIPQRDDSETGGVDEYSQTKSRVSLKIAFTPATPEEPADPGDITGGSGFVPVGPPPAGFGGGFGTGSNGIAPSGDSQPSGQTPVAVRQPTRSMPQLPWYVWVLVPVGLLLTSTVRAVVLEPVGGARTGGVIEAIRAKNAELRGMGSTPAGRRRFGRLRVRPIESIQPAVRRAADVVADWTGRAWRKVRR